MRKSLAHKGQQGFTLIELVVVIVILGILAATALPRFANLQSNARQAAVQAMGGAISSAMAIAHAQALVNGTNTVAASPVTLDGVAINMAWGYPDGTAGGIIAAAGLGGASWVTSAQSAAGVTIQPATNGSATCQAVYNSAAALGGSAAVTVQFNGC